MKVYLISLISLLFFSFCMNTSFYLKFQHPVSAKQVMDNSDDILIFGYGSLVNPDSAKRSLSQKALKSYKPAVALGIRRVFNFKAPKDFVLERYGEQARLNDRAALNIVPTGKESDLVNGVVFKVGLDDLKKLIKREKGYDLVPVKVILWDDFHESNTHKTFIAYTFSASAEEFVNDSINPIPDYARLSMAGAKHHGSKFYSFWIKTTYLADKRTPFSFWEKNPTINCTKLGCS